jgi:hypothetical protein
MLNNEMRQQGFYIPLLVDNTPTHPHPTADSLALATPNFPVQKNPN